MLRKKEILFFNSIGNQAAQIMIGSMDKAPVI